MWRQYLLYVLRLLGSMDGVESEDVYELGYWVGRCLRVDDRVKEAMGRLEHVVKI